MAFFYRHSPRKFNYKPRYYDPDQQAWEEKKAEKGLDANLTHEEQLRMRMRSSWGKRNAKESKEEQRAKLIRRVVWGVLVLFIVYFIFFTPVLENIVKGLMGK